MAARDQPLAQGDAGAMNESEFRDWTRAQLRTLDERIRAVAARPVEPAKLEVPGKVKGDMAKLAANLIEEVRAGRVAGLAIAYVTEEGTPMTGWVEGAQGAFTLSGAAAFVGLEMLDSVRQREREEKAAGEAKDAGV
jgi:hypothetical protein